MPSLCKGCQVKRMVPSAGLSRYVQKKGARSLAIWGAFISHLATSLKSRRGIAGYRKDEMRWTCGICKKSVLTESTVARYFPGCIDVRGPAGRCGWDRVAPCWLLRAVSPAWWPFGVLDGSLFGNEWSESIALHQPRAAGCDVCVSLYEAEGLVGRAQHGR